ncbi:MAG TPA: hypothetical protein VL490_04445 [Mucilaginibacter sp.]|nr:hypothetical protein [Mucilaginibacter sp.]
MKTKTIPLLAGLLFAAGTLKAQQPPPMQPPSPEMRLKHVSERLEKDLALKPNQKQKVLDAYKAFFKDMDKLRGANPPPPPPPGKKEDVDKLVKARDESIKKTLTDEQFKKYQEIEKTMRPPGRGPNGGPGGPPPPQGQ